MDPNNDAGMQPGQRQGGFPVDRPTEALRMDHDMVRMLADKYINGNSPEVKKQAATQMLQALHTHSRLEESVFYPGVRNIDPNMIGHFEQDHLKVDDLLATLQGMPLDDQHSDRLMRDLINMTMQHIQQEENDFFPKLEAANLDLSQLGAQMQAFEANLIHTQAQVGQTQARP